MVRQARAAGLVPYRVVSVRRYAAIVRSLLAPGVRADDLDGVGGPWSGVPRLRATGQAVVARLGDATWWHSIAVIDKDGWPPDWVGPNFLDDLLGDIPGAPYRLVVTQLGTMPRRKAQDKARVSGALAGATAIAEARASDFSTGEASQRAAGAQSMLDELLAHAVGTMPVLRVMVSAPTGGELATARQAVRETLDTMGFSGDYWCDGWQARALNSMLLMGRGLR
jgi:hypothetical protein